MPSFEVNLEGDVIDEDGSVDRLHELDMFTARRGKGLRGGGWKQKDSC